MNPLYVVNINLIDALKFATKTLNYSMQLNCDNFVMKPNPAMQKLGMQAIEHGVGGNVWIFYAVFITTTSYSRVLFCILMQLSNIFNSACFDLACHNSINDKFIKPIKLVNY